MLCFLFLLVMIIMIHSGRIANKCISIIEALPSLPVRPDDSPLSWLIPQQADDVKDFKWLLSLCIQRFAFVEAQHRANKFAVSPKSILEIPAIATKNRLFILDLDETLVYQRTSLIFNNDKDMEAAFEQLGDYNEQSLLFSMQQRGTHEVAFNIYRPELMEFINKYQHEYDFVLYTAATVNIAVFHVVMIEMYYNYWYCTDTRRCGMFYFKNAVFRMPDIETKSINVLARIMYFKDYDKAMIIDDHLHSEFDDYKVWDLPHNESLYLSGYQIKPWNLGNDDGEIIMEIESSETMKTFFKQTVEKTRRFNDTELLMVGNFLCGSYDSDLYTPRCAPVNVCSNPMTCGYDGPCQIL